MREAHVPLAYRDSCAHLLIPLNRCRKDTYYAPWKCTVGQPRCRMCWDSDERQDERHSYEKCQYEEFQRRVAKMDELRAQRDGKRSN
jgi:hypothetical protein